MRFAYSKRMAYSKLHSSVVYSSLWSQRDHVRLLFITLLAVCDKDGCVYGSRSGFERLSMIDPDACEELDPWSVLLGPDSDSSDKMRAPENEGRRIEEIPGGFRLLNFAYYRGLRNDDDRREQNRLAQERFRNKNKPRSATVSHVKPPKAHTEADAEAGGRKQPPSDSEMIVWENRSYYPSALREMLKMVKEEMADKDGEELKFLRAKQKSLKIALGVKFPKAFKPKVVASEPVRKPLSPEETRTLADALHQSAEAGA